MLTHRKPAIGGSLPDPGVCRVGEDPGPLAELDGQYLSPRSTGGPARRVAGVRVAYEAAAFDWFGHRDRSATPTGPHRPGERRLAHRWTRTFPGGSS